MEIVDIPRKSNSREMTDRLKQFSAEELNAIVDAIKANGDDISSILADIAGVKSNVSANTSNITQLNSAKYNLFTSTSYNALSSLASGIYTSVNTGAPNGTDASYTLIVGGASAKIAIGNTSGRTYRLDGTTWIEFGEPKANVERVKKESKSAFGDVVVHKMIPSIPRKGKRYFFKDGVVKIRLDGKHYNEIGTFSGLVPTGFSNVTYYSGKKRWGYGGFTRGIDWTNYTSNSAFTVARNLRAGGVVYVRIKYDGPVIVTIKNDGYFAFSSLDVSTASNLYAHTEDKWLSIQGGKIVCDMPVNVCEDELRMKQDELNTERYNLNKIKQISTSTCKKANKVIISKLESLTYHLMNGAIRDRSKKYKWKKMVDAKGNTRRVARSGRCQLRIYMQHKGHFSKSVMHADFLVPRPNPQGT